MNDAEFPAESEQLTDATPPSAPAADVQVPLLVPVDTLTVFPPHSPDALANMTSGVGGVGLGHGRHPTSSDDTTHPATRLLAMLKTFTMRLTVLRRKRGGATVTDKKQR